MVVNQCAVKLLCIVILKCINADLCSGMIAFSKKDPAIRRKELLDYVSRPLVDYVSSQCEALVRDSSLLLVVLCVLQHATCKYTCTLAQSPPAYQL